MLDYIIFIENINDFKIEDDAELFQLDAKYCDTKENLFKYFAEKLSFPDYFGKNWDAFDECIHDLEWVKDKTNKSKVYIYIYNLEYLLKNDSKKNKDIFFEIINTEDTYIDEFNNPVEIKFIFNESDKSFYKDIKFK